VDCRSPDGWRTSLHSVKIEPRAAGPNLMLHSPNPEGDKIVGSAYMWRAQHMYFWRFLSQQLTKGAAADKQRWEVFVPTREFGFLSCQDAYCYKDAALYSILCWIWNCLVFCTACFPSPPFLMEGTSCTRGTYWNSH
jgi:hypothetical protein